MPTSQGLRLKKRIVGPMVAYRAAAVIVNDARVLKCEARLNVLRTRPV